MIRTRKEALTWLGLTDGASMERIKSAYRLICKKCHPDSIPMDIEDKEKEKLLFQYQMASEAYDYLISVKETNRYRVLGYGSSASTGDKQSNRLRKEQLESEAKARKEKKYKELQEEGRRLRQKEEAGKILDEIRWMRLANIIKNTMEEDRRRSELEEKISEAIRKKQQ